MKIFNAIPLLLCTIVAANPITEPLTDIVQREAAPAPAPVPEPVPVELHEFEKRKKVKGSKNSTSDAGTVQVSLGIAGVAVLGAILVA